ncbi:MAG TPA: hypothetical protein VFQ98_06155 [Gallionella sp.]|nr:hypothetical protein [Gallionella sp.]
MFFKKRVSVPQYCDARLSILFSQEQARQWVCLKDEFPDATLRNVDEQLFLDEMRAAHLQLISLAITKQYHDIEIAMEVSACVSSFLAKGGNQKLEDAEHTYNQAFGSSPTDGVLAMARLFSTRVAKGALSQETVADIRETFYSALASVFADFKQVKIVAS